MARPRKHPEGTTASAVARAQEAAVIARGGRRLTLLLSPEANARLEAIRRPAEPGRPRETAKAAIERLLRESGGA